MCHLFLSNSLALALAIAVAAPALGESPMDPLLRRLNTEARQVTVIENVTVIPMDAEHVLSNQTVVIRQGRIFEIGLADSTPVPEDAQRIDGRGKYLIPRLADMHFHLQGPEADPEEINACLLFFIANGVTTVRSTLGKPNHLEIRDKIKAGQLFGPNLYLASPPMHSKSITTVTAAREFVFKSKAEGYDLIKLHDISDSTIYDAAIQAAKEVSLPCFGHVTSEIGIDRALKASQSIEESSPFLVGNFHGS